MNLSESDQRLLMAYFDGGSVSVAVPWYRRLRLKALLLSNEGQRELLALRSLSSALKAGMVAETPEIDPLWDRIERRIEQEERSAVYLGRRTEGEGRVVSPFSDWLRSLGAPLGFGLAGALAALAVVRLPSTDSVHVASDLESVWPSKRPVLIRSMNGAGANGASPAGLSSMAPQFVRRSVVPADVTRQRLSPSREPAIDVDWVHSDGAVRFYSNPSGKSTMIWVRKKTPERRKARRDPSLADSASQRFSPREMFELNVGDR
jgi:hypothetical protein